MTTNPKDIAAVIARAQAQPGIADIKELMGKPPTGWLCPACHKGNAPDVKTCGHCAKQTAVTTNFDYWEHGKTSIRRAGDMPRDWSL